MAEEYVKLVKIGLDPSVINESIKNADRLTAEINKLRAAQKESGVQDAETTGKIKALTLERNRDIEVVKQANLLNTAAANSNAEMKAQLSLLTAQYNKLTKEEKDNTEAGQQMGKTIRSISDELKANEKAIGDNRRNVGNYAEGMEEALNKTSKFGSTLQRQGGVMGAFGSAIVFVSTAAKEHAVATAVETESTAVNTAATTTNTASKEANAVATTTAGTAAAASTGGFAAATGGMMAMTTAALSFIATPLGLVLGAIVLAIASVKSAFTSSEEGQNKWNKIVMIGSTLIGNFTDILASFGESIISVFENPQKAVKDFATILKDNIINRFNGLIELVPALGKSIEQLFKGNFAEAGKIAADAAAKVALGVENITEKTKGAIAGTKAFIDEQKKEAAEAAKVSDMRSKADIIERDLLVKRAQMEAKVAELRLNAKKEDEFTAAQRKKFLTDANQIQNELLDAETSYLKLRADAQTLENTFSRTNKENKVKEAEAIAALSQVETKRFTEQRALQRELNKITRELESEQKAISAEKKKQTEEEKKAEKERIKAIEQGYKDERALIDDMAETKRNQAVIDIANNEQRAEAIRYIDKQVLLDKIASIDEETIAATASGDAIGAADQVKFARQLAERSKYQAQITAMDRAAKAEAFTNQIDLLNGQEQLDIQAAELSIDNEQELQNKKYQIALDYATKRVALMRESAMIDGVLTEKEIQNLQAVENTIKKLQATLANPEAPTAAQSLGLSEDQISDMQLGLTAISQALSAVQAATQANADNRMAEIDAQSNAEVAAVEKSTLSEEQKKTKITAIEKKAAMEKYKIELAQFKVAKALQIGLAIANTATAVMAQLSNPTPYAGFVLAALAAVTGGVQIGIIASQKPPAPPAFASGGYVSGAGSGTSDSINAKLSNGESVNTAKATAMFAPMLSAMNAAGGGVDWYKGEGFSKGGLAHFAAGGIVSSSSQMIRENEAATNLSNTFMMSQPVLVLEDFQNVQGRQIRTEMNLQV